MTNLSNLSLLRPRNLNPLLPVHKGEKFQWNNKSGTLNGELPDLKVMWAPYLMEKKGSNIGFIVSGKKETKVFVLLTIKSDPYGGLYAWVFEDITDPSFTITLSTRNPIEE